MINIYEYLLSKTKPKLVFIKATDETIHQIVAKEIGRLGNEADLNHIDVSEVTNMQNLFCAWPGAMGFKEYESINPEISEWDVSKVTNMRGMFCGCQKFNCDISEWNVKKVKNFNSMFIECYEFNQPLGKWEINSMEDATCMFKDCKSFDQDLSSWNNKFISNVVSTSSKWDGHKLSSMFSNTKMELEKHIEYYPSEALYNLLDKK